MLGCLLNGQVCSGPPLTLPLATLFLFKADKFQWPKFRLTLSERGLTFFFTLAAGGIFNDLLLGFLISCQGEKRSALRSVVVYCDSQERSPNVKR